VSQPLGAIRIVLDSSAMLAYAATSISVGETIAEVADEGCRFGLPMVCLAEASRLMSEEQVAALLLLVRHPSAVVTSTPVADWEVLAEWTRGLGRVDLASALAEAIAHNGYVLTGEPATYGDIDELPVIPI
jgi:hypothetical protein